MRNKSGLIKTTLTALVIICGFLISFSESAEQKLLVVMDLYSDGSVTDDNIRSISDKISEIAANDSTYTQFSREMLPELFNQLAIDQASVKCSDRQCLALAGSIIGANAVIGGTISMNRKQMKIELNLVDVTAKASLNSVSILSSSKKSVFLEKELPAFVNNLLDSNVSPPAKVKTAGKNRFFSSPFLYATMALAAGAAAAFYFVNDRDHSSGNGESIPLTLDDLPSPTRGSH